MRKFDWPRCKRLLAQLLCSSVALIATPSFAQADALIDRVFAPLRALPFPNCGNGNWSTAIDALRNGLSASGNGWRSSTHTCGLQLYVQLSPASGVPSDAAIYLVLDRSLKLSDIPNLKGNKWKNIGDVQMNRPVLSIATKEHTLNVSEVPASFRAMFAGEPRYKGLQEFSVPIGPQIFTHASIAGGLGSVLKSALNAPVDNLWLRAGFSSESVSDMLSRDGSKFLEVLMPVGTILSGPLGITEARVTDATITVDDGKNITLLGNMSFQSVPGKVFPAFVDLPALPTGGINWAKAQMGLSTPSVITLEEFAKVGMAFNAQVATGGLAGIGPAKSVMDKIATMFKPLSAFKMTNPDANADQFRLRAGTSFPDTRRFNLLVLSKEAKAKDESNTSGPLIRVRGRLFALGQQLATTNTDLSTSGLYTDTGVSLRVSLPKLGAALLGSASLKMQIDQNTQSIVIKGPLPPDRSVEFAFGRDGIAFNSPASCATPFGISASLPFTDAPDLSNLPTVDVDPAKLPGCIAQAGKEIVKFVKNTFDREPPRASYDCTNFRDPAFYNAYPPGRIWGARDEYTQNASSGAWARYVFSEDTQKFHPFGAKGALGATACGGLVGEKGVGLGRLNTADDEIWNLVLMCNTIPAALKGPPVNTANECYALRGMVAPRPALAGKMVVAQGDTSKTTLFVDDRGVGRRIGGGNDWRVWSECGLGSGRYPATTVSLHEIHGIKVEPPIGSAAECRAVMGRHWKRHPRTGQVVFYGDQYKNMAVVGADGRKRWLGNKDNWNIYRDCNLDASYENGISLAEFTDIPDGPAIGSGNECRAAIAQAGGRVPPAFHPRAGQVVYYNDQYKNHAVVTRDGKKRWLANKDNWTVYQACGLDASRGTSITLAEFMAIPDGPAITTGDECKRAIADGLRR
jgi:hypothetical protein